MKVISVCHPVHLECFKQTAKYVLKFIEAASYEVIVPTNSISLFKQNIPSAWQVIDEITIGNFNLPYIANNANSIKRPQWIYQQLLKLQRLIDGAIQGYENLLIWDADTVPLTYFNPFADTNFVNFVWASEYHTPYFESIKIILDLEKNTPFSYISQHFPCKSKWILHFIDYIEQKHNLKWYDVIINKIVKNYTENFSEYETLGTFVQHFYPSELKLNSNIKWDRNGWRHSNLDQLDTFINNKSNNLSFISYEEWQKPS